MTPLRTVSFGGGVQSVALLVLAAEQRVDVRTFLFANAGDDSEYPSTWEYLRTVAAPFAAAHGLAPHRRPPRCLHPFVEVESCSRVQ